MIVSEIVGGLGNQLFQYASARQLSILMDQEIHLDLNFFKTYHNPDVFRLDKFNVRYQVADQDEINRLKRVQATGLLAKVYRKIFKKPYYHNAKHHFDQNWLRNNDWDKLKKYRDVYISGYLADPTFFYHIEEVIKREFTLREPLNEANAAMAEKIRSSEAVMLHVRRGDYVSNDFFVSLPVSYYKKAIEKVESEVKDPVFYVFSDDLNWTRENIKTNHQMIYCDINDGKTDYMELALMAACSHAIIANSTFSWWGAWLINHPGKIVIAPQQWYANKKAQEIYLRRKIFQEGWQRL